MSEKDYYERLLRKMDNASGNLNTTLNDIDSLKTRLSQSLSINEYTYREGTVNDLRKKVSDKKDRIDNVIIPKIKEEIKRIEDEESEDEEQGNNYGQI